MAKFELYGTASCAYTAEMRESLEWRRADFVEYDVEADPQAYERMIAFSNGWRMVPVLVQDGHAIEVGWHGRGCIVGPSPAEKA